MSKTTAPVVEGPKFDLQLNESKSQHISDCVGMSDERHKEINEAVKDAILSRRHNTKTGVMKEVAAKCETLGELCYAMYTIGARLEEQFDPAESLAKMLGGIRRLKVVNPDKPAKKAGKKGSKTEEMEP